MNKILPILATLALCGAAGAAPARAAGAPAAVVTAPDQGYDLRIRVWADSDRDQFRPGERVRMQFHANRSAYAAVVHISTDGEVEFLYPRSPWDDGYVQGGRSYSLPYGGGGYASSWTVRGGPGIGYVFMVASDEPLDFRAFQDYRNHSRWGYRTIGRSFRGDPYYALDRIVDQLVPDPDYSYYVTDSFAYHVGGRHSYPRWSCYDGYADAYAWGGHYGRCDRLRVLLRDDPYYYDPRRYRRSRGYYLADSRRYQPEHRYKEPRAAAGRDGYGDRDRSGRGGSYDAPPPRRSGDSYDPPSRTRPEPSSRGENGGGYTRADWQQGQQPQQEGKRQREERPRTEERSRPTLQRRPTDPETSRPRVTAPQREPRREAPQREEPRREAPPAREEPQREAPRERPRAEPPSQERSRPSEGGSARVRPEGEP
jgi:hypothetical protein